MIARRDVLGASSRCNVVARLAHMVAALECSLNARGAAQAWKSLSVAEKNAADAALVNVIAEARKEIEE